MYLHEELTERIIGCAINVHRVLGPGLLEATYEAAFCLELTHAAVPFERQLRLPVTYRGHLIGEYRPDLVIDRCVVVEVKSVERFAGVHRAQILAYLRVLNLRVGLLMNFNSEVMRTGIKRVAL
jgi:GxxExxY protein